MKFCKNKRAQATLEVVLTFAVLVLFLMGIVKTMLWFGNNLGARARYYRLSRPLVVSSPGAAGVDYRQTELSLFKD